DYSDVRGQEFCKRALTIAAGGNHNMFILGPCATNPVTCSIGTS
ncbi:MAG: ATP-binding protein, partial [Deltaproteobacteria bacterium]|nr:ATP-binding protein [Deltaproteobacteria bacterium]